MNKAAMRSVMAKHSDTQQALAEALELPVSGLNARINGHIDFRAGEIIKIIQRYGLSDQETMEIFFETMAS